MLIEAMTYRIGAHSTSDDDTKYRHPHSPEPGWDSERAYWEARSPIIRFGRYMQSRGWWNPQMEEDLRLACRKLAVTALNVASTAPKPKVDTLFSDVFDELTWIQQEQQDEMFGHMARFPEHYDSWANR